MMKKILNKVVSSTLIFILVFLLVPASIAVNAASETQVLPTASNRAKTTTQDNGWGTYGGSDGNGGAFVKGGNWDTSNGIYGYYYVTSRFLDLGKVYTFDGTQRMETTIGLNSVKAEFDYSSDGVSWESWNGSDYSSNLGGSSEWIDVSKSSDWLKGKSIRYFRLLTTYKYPGTENNSTDDIVVKIFQSTSTTPPGGGTSGTIVFNPNSTVWTNLGKTGEGTGKYPVNVSYVGTNPITNNGVTYSLSSISVTGAASATVSGTSGNVNITQEGENLQLHGVGKWTSSGSPPVGQTSTPPANPTGDSGYYNLDWTKPDVSFSINSGICSPSSGATRAASKSGTGDGFFGKLTVDDGDLSGVKQIYYGWSYGTSSPTYKKVYSGIENTGAITVNIEKPVGDNLYLWVKTRDIAGNENDTSFGPYEDPIKLKDFEVTDVRDPKWDKVFWTDLTFTKLTGFTFKANKLPVDNTSNPIYHNADIKKGYAFYFDMTSEYLYRDSDRIEISPSFYYWDGTTRTPVDMYYELNNNPFIKFGSTADAVTIDLKVGNGYVYIGKLPLLTLTKGVRVDENKSWSDWKGTLQYSYGKTQWWYGQYYIPETAKFVKVGQTPRPENVLDDKNIIVNFTIIAYKNGGETISQDQIFSYLNTTGYWSANNTSATVDEWTAENGPKNANYKKGDVLVYNNSKCVLDDYTTYVTH